MVDTTNIIAIGKKGHSWPFIKTAEGQNISNMKDQSGAYLAARTSVGPVCIQMIRTNCRRRIFR